MRDDLATSESIIASGRVMAVLSAAFGLTLSWTAAIVAGMIFGA